MNVNKPASALPVVHANIGHALNDGASAIANALTPSAAGAAGVTQIHRLPLSMLGNDNAAASAAAPAFVATSDNDTLGIIAAYLSQDDQLIMREVDSSIRAVVDLAIHSLKLGAREACSLFSQPHNLSKLRELHLTDVNDKDLIDLAGALARMPNTDFKLILEKPCMGDRSGATADGLRPLVALRLSGITLDQISISVDMSRVLALSVSPLSIKLPYNELRDSDLYELSQIPMLRSLQAAYLGDMTPKAINALRSHERLERFEIHELSASYLEILAASTHIRSLKVEFIAPGGQTAALTALAANRVLTSLDVAVDQGNALSVLSHNASLQVLRIKARSLAPSSLTLIAAMPSLKEFHLSSHYLERQLSIGINDIAALCTKQWESLSFRDIQMDGAARSLLATAKTAKLVLERCTPFESQDFAVLNRNRSITSLFMGNVDRFSHHEDILSMVTDGMPQLESLDITVKNDGSVMRAITAAWLASGRQSGNLHLQFLQPKALSARVLV